MNKETPLNLNDAVDEQPIDYLPHLHEPSVRSACEMLIERFDRARCDSDGVSRCIRCNSVYLAKSILEAMEKGKSDIGADSGD